MMKQYMKNKSRLGFFLAMCLGLFSCSKFLEENPKDKLILNPSVYVRANGYPRLSSTPKVEFTVELLIMGESPE